MSSSASRSRLPVFTPRRHSSIGNLTTRRQYAVQSLRSPLLHSPSSNLSFSNVSASGQDSSSRLSTLVSYSAALFKRSGDQQSDNWRELELQTLTDRLVTQLTYFILNGSTVSRSSAPGGEVMDDIRNTMAGTTNDIAELVASLEIRKNFLRIPGLNSSSKNQLQQFKQSIIKA